MSDAARRPRRWVVPAVSLVVAGFIGARVWLGVVYGLGVVNDASVGDTILMMGAFATYLAVGLVLVARRPENRLGWVLTAIGLLTVVGALAESYAMVAMELRAEQGGLPGGIIAAWIHNWYWYPLLVLIVLFVPLLFPTGRPLTPRWNWVYYAASIVLVAITVVSWLKPTLTDGALRNPVWVADNPIGVTAAGDLERSTHGNVLFMTVLALAVLAMVSLVLRFRRSRGIERQQMKLFIFAGVLMVSIPLAEELGLFAVLPESNLYFAVTIAMPPIAIGVAVLRYRLYDIDRLISRTVSYALLTTLLLALYLASVTTLTAITTPVAGDSPIAVAAATLLAAAAFRPARRRIQGVVDRRFDRARYDAARTVEEYRSALRDEVELSSLTKELRSAVERTVAPIKTVVWLRDTPREEARP